MSYGDELKLNLLISSSYITELIKDATWITPAGISPSTLIDIDIETNIDIDIDMTWPMVDDRGDLYVLAVGPRK